MINFCYGKAIKFGILTHPRLTIHGSGQHDFMAISIALIDGTIIHVGGDTCGCLRTVLEG